MRGRSPGLLMCMFMACVPMWANAAKPANADNFYKSVKLEMRTVTFPEDACQEAAEPKELVIVPGARHMDLHERVGLIPFARLTEFFRHNLK